MSEAAPAPSKIQLVLRHPLAPIGLAFLVLLGALVFRADLLESRAISHYRTGEISQARPGLRLFGVGCVGIVLYLCAPLLGAFSPRGPDQGTRAARVLSVLFVLVMALTILRT